MQPATEISRLPIFLFSAAWWQTAMSWILPWGCWSTRGCWGSLTGYWRWSLRRWAWESWGAFEGKRNINWSTMAFSSNNFGLPKKTDCVCCAAVSTHTRGHKWVTGISWRVGSFTWLWGGRGLRSCPTLTCSSPSPEVQGGFMGKHRTACP